MGSDHFRFDTLLKIRENLRDQRRVELSAAERLRDESASRLAESERLLKESRAQWRKAMEGSAPPLDRIARFRNYQDRLLERQKSEQARLTELTAQLDHRRALFEEAVRDVRILENLRRKKEEQLAEFQRKKGEI